MGDGGASFSGGRTTAQRVSRHGASIPRALRLLVRKEMPGGHSCTLPFWANVAYLCPALTGLVLLGWNKKAWAGMSLCLPPCNVSCRQWGWCNLQSPNHQC